MNPRRLHLGIVVALIFLGAPQAVRAQTISLFPDEVPNGIAPTSGKQYHQRFNITLTGSPVQASRAFTITVPAELTVVSNSVTATTNNTGVIAFFSGAPSASRLAFGLTGATLSGATVTVEFDLTTQTSFTGITNGSKVDTSYAFDFSGQSNLTDTNVPVAKHQNRPVRTISFTAPDSTQGDTTIAGGRFYKLAFPSALSDPSHTGISGLSASAGFTDNRTDVLYSFYISTDSSLVERPLDLSPMSFFTHRPDGDGPLSGTRQNPRFVPGTFIREDFTTQFSSATADSLNGVISLAAGTADNTVYFVYVLADPAPGRDPLAVYGANTPGSAKKGFDGFTLGAFSGGVFLGRSGPLLVQHPPEFVVVGWDYDDDNGDEFDNTGIIQVPSDMIGMASVDANRKDNRNITLDTGSFIPKGLAFSSLNNGVAPDPIAAMDFLFLAQDVDNPAAFEMNIFLSTQSGLDVDDLVGTGVDSLSGALKVAGSDTININSRTFKFIALEVDSVTSLVNNFTPKGVYFVYFAAWDGDDDHRTVIQAFNDPFISSPTAATLTVEHSPNLTADVFALNSFDGSGDGDLDVVTGIDVSQMFSDVDGKDLIQGPAQRFVSISWGEQGLSGDLDVDDNATIELYYSTRSDFRDVRGSVAFTSGNSDGTDLLNAVEQGNNDTHKIGEVKEDPDGRFDNQFVWDIWTYVSPEEGTGGTIPMTGVRYYIYALLREGGDIDRLVSLTQDNPSPGSSSAVSMALNFLHPPYIRPIEPSRDITVTLNEPVLVSWEAVDVDNEEAGGLTANPSGFGRIASNSRTASPNIRILLTSADFGEVTTWGTVTSFTTTDRFWVGNSGDGSLVEEIELNEGVDTSFVIVGNRIRNNLSNTSSLGGSSGTLELQTNNGLGETYFVYLAMDDGRDGTVADAVTSAGAQQANFGGFSSVVRAPGRITFTGTVPASPPTSNRFIIPTRMETAVGEVIKYPIILEVGVSGDTMKVVDIFITVDADKFEAIDTNASTAGIQPFSLGLNSEISAANVQQNASVQGDKLRLDFVYTDLPGGLTFFDGEEVLTFANLRAKQLADTATVRTTISLDNSADRASKLLDANTINVNAFVPQPTEVTINRRTQVSGKVPLQGRTSSADTVTFMLREVGSFTTFSDTLFEQNDVDASTFGVQVATTDIDGKFTLRNVPSGRFVLTASIFRHLTGHDTIDVQPGLDLTNIEPTVDGGGVDRTFLLAGDAAGFADSTGTSLPDNAINDADINSINDAIFSQPGDADFNTFADINRDNIVNATDKDFASANQTDNTGSLANDIRPVFPVFKQALPEGDNAEALVSLTDLPEGEIKAGESFDVTVKISGARAVRTYEVHLAYDSTKLAMEGLMSSGSLLKDYLTDVTGKVSEEGVGLVNSVLGHTPLGASGEGSLATVRFRAIGRAAETKLILSDALLIDVNHVSAKPKLDGEVTIVLSKDPIVYHDTEGNEIKSLILADVDSKVDFNDFLVLARVFGTSVGSPTFDLRADLNGDDTVNFADFMIFAADFGKVAVDAPSSGGAGKPAPAVGINGKAKMSLKVEGTATMGEDLILKADLSQAEAVQGWGLTVRFDSRRYAFVEAIPPPANLLTASGATAPLFLVHREGSDRISLASAISEGEAASGAGALAVLVFRPRTQVGDAQFEISEGVLFDPDYLVNAARFAETLEVPQASWGSVLFKGLPGLFHTRTESPPSP